MKPFLLFLVLLVLSRIETNEATRTLDETNLLLSSLQTRSRVTERNFASRKKVIFAFPPPPHTNAYPFDENHDLLLPSLQTRPPVKFKTPTPNLGTKSSVDTEITVTERNFIGCKEVFSPPPSTNAYTLDKIQLLLPSLKIRSPVRTPTPNLGTEASMDMTSKVAEKHFDGRKEIVFAPPPPPLHEPLLLPSLRTRPLVKSPTPTPGTETSVDMASGVTTEKNFVGRKEVAFAPPLREPLLLPSLQTRPPIKTPTPNPGTNNGVNIASRVTERNFVGHKEVVFAPPPPPLHEPLLLPSLQTRPPIKTPTPNAGTKASMDMASKVTEKNFVGRKEIVFAPPPPPLHEPLLLPSFRTRPPVKTPTPNPGTEASVDMASGVTEKNFVGRKEVVFVPPPPHLHEPLLLPFIQTRPPINTPTPNPGTEASVDIVSGVTTEKNFVGHKEVVFTPPPPPLHEPLLLPALQTRPPVKIPPPNPGTKASMDMASKVAEKHFDGRKEIVFAPPPPPLHEPLLLPSLRTRPLVKSPTPNPGTEASVDMASGVTTEKNFVGRKEVVFAPPPPPLREPLLLPSLQTRPPIKTPTPNPGTNDGVNVASRVTERNFVGHKEVVFAPPPPPLHEPLLLPSLQTRPPIKTPTPNPGTNDRVNVASRVTERDFVGHKEVVFAPPLHSIY
ncbi:pollen-specific leucine-rich repeat extensin-like protein 3 [Capsicum galapagoense]